jgi:hypothetical protein
MTTTLVLDCLEQAIWTRQRERVHDLAGLVRHNDASSQLRRDLWVGCGRGDDLAGGSRRRARRRRRRG